ncbi:hypothetical protein [Nocardia speluncae]|uniref:hypothetical protein n=1 Tax=Nocardia speluncae TaxID=419477 RepID=UPI000AA5D6BD|nr:hypothetical protein [Nocardia speluncae]
MSVPIHRFPSGTDRGPRRHIGAAVAPMNGMAPEPASWTGRGACGCVRVAALWQGGIR